MGGNCSGTPINSHGLFWQFEFLHLVHTAGRTLKLNSFAAGLCLDYPDAHGLKTIRTRKDVPLRLRSRIHLRSKP